MSKIIDLNKNGAFNDIQNDLQQEFGFSIPNLAELQQLQNSNDEDSYDKDDFFDDENKAFFDSDEINTDFWTDDEDSTFGNDKIEDDNAFWGEDFLKIFDLDSIFGNIFFENFTASLFNIIK